MPVSLTKEELVTIHVLLQKGLPCAEIARQLGVSEGTVRYHRKKAEHPRDDGRKEKTSRAASYAPVIAQWLLPRLEKERPPNVSELFD